LHWIDRYGDIDGDGFVEYHAKRQAQGIRNQGWKDSVDCIVHADGRIADTPIALCEVQGYVYAAKLGASKLAKALGDQLLEQSLIHEAQLLRKRFHESFWDERLGTFVLALDRDKAPCKVVSSNPGHCLYTGIVEDAYVEKIVSSLISPEMYSGWGIRTLSAKEERFNPMSYHNGSVWPHDNSLAALGMVRYGYRREALMVMRGLFEASKFLELGRLPELFCGFWRRQGEGPTHYPVSCSPQAWATGTAFAMLQACLGIEINAIDKTVILGAQSLPNYLNEVSLANLSLGDSHAELQFSGKGDNVGITVKSKPQGWKFISG
jgi:glycogen debranching enzyme